MSIIYSAEIRWIIAGNAPTSIKRWYEDDKQCNREKVRVDYYLRFPGDEFVGIKLRKYEDGGQNLEFKPIKKSAVAWQLSSEIAGRVEEWEKGLHKDSCKSGHSIYEGATGRLFLLFRTDELYRLFEILE